MEQHNIVNVVAYLIAMRADIKFDHYSLVIRNDNDKLIRPECRVTDYVGRQKINGNDTNVFYLYHLRAKRTLKVKQFVAVLVPLASLAEGRDCPLARNEKTSPVPGLN
jgi:hypothetical protein